MTRLLGLPLLKGLERSEFVGNAEAKGAFGEGGMSDALGSLRGSNAQTVGGATWGAGVQGQSGAVSGTSLPAPDFRITPWDGGR